MAAGTVDDPEQFAAFLAELTPSVAELVGAADRLVRTVDPGVVQVLWIHQRTVGYGVGPKKLSEHYCYLDVYERHINLGFNRGALLPDPTGLLDGTGAKFRKMSLSTVQELEEPAVRDLITAARDERLAALS